MDTKEPLNKIAKLKNAIDLESDADTKKLYQKKVDALEKQIAEAEQKVEKVEAKAAAEEKKDLNEAEEKIKKLKSALALESDPDTKALYQKKISKLEETLKDVKQEIKEEKKEIAEQKKDIKQATKEVKSAQKEVRKTAIKKVAAKQVERKQVVTRKAKRKTKIKTIISDLDKLINKNKELKAKYKDKGVDLKKDAARSAKPFGYRFVGKHDYRVPTEAQVRRGLKRGTIDYEARPNRSDKYPKATVKLADGGMMADGGMTKEKDFYLVENFKGENYTVHYNALITPTGDWTDTYNCWIDRKSKMFGGSSHSVLKIMSEKDAKSFIENVNEKNIKNLYNEFREKADGGMMRRGGRTKEAITADKRYKALKAGRRVSEDGNVYYESRANRSDVSRRDKLADGGMMARGGAVKKKVASKSNPKPSKKVGKSVQDKHRFAKPAGWRWKEEAFEKRIIERKQLAMSPSKKMRDKYPDLVYFEDRLNKADAKPTRTSADSI
jgi:chemotaxis protein histidine kinase CheA